MYTQYYKEAQKLAQKERRRCISRGQYPYLSVLDDFIPAEKSAAATEVGTIQIPIEWIVGTKTEGRTTAFARNYMPLLDESTEFAAKWMKLCGVHLEEGLRDPIEVYEYMNRYYVAEGNKRVSVLKYFGAVTIAAHAVRILPERGSQETEIYYESLDFNKYSKINFIEFSHPGRYLELQRLVGKKPGEAWTEEERRNFSSAYYRFKKVYEAKGGKRLLVTVGDAMIAYMKVYGYQELHSKSEQEIKKSIGKIWEEFTLQQEDSLIDLKLAPNQEKKPGILLKILPNGESKERRVAFINDKSPSDSGWTYGHELGRLHVQQVFHGHITTTAYHDAMAGDPSQVIEQAIKDKNTILFTTAPRMLSVSLRAAVEHPEITILNCSLNKSHRYIRTYYARMYEVKFIIGAIAGSLAGGRPVGYICNYPIFGQIAEINAFALGAKMVNPNAKVYLEWSCVNGLSAATQRLTDRGIALISSQDLANPNAESYTFGLSHITKDGPVNLAMPVWHWGVYYETILRHILNRSFQSEYEESTKALNYYWGMEAGVVELFCSKRLPDGTQKLAEFLRQGICSGICKPFYGPLCRQDGQVIHKEGHSLSPEQIVNMDWLVDNVIGDLPDYEQLTDVGKSTVDMVGVEPSTKDRSIKERQSST